MADYDKAVAAAPNEGRWLNARARLKNELGDLDGARTDCRKAIAIFSAAIAADPKDRLAYYHRGFSDLACRDPRGAIDDETRAIALDPGHGPAYLERAAAYWYFAEYARAEADSEAALKIDAGDGDAYLQLSGLKTDEKDYDAALGYLAKALAQPDETVGVVLNNRCWTRGVLDRELEAAQADCEAALKDRPNALAARGSLALVQFRQAKFDAALATLDAILGEQPRRAEALLLRAAVKARLGRDGAADLALGEALDPFLALRLRRFGILP
ncbi:MAG: hypothetical protein WDM81_15150 [Rhizomicrobium sp.]